MPSLLVHVTHGPEAPTRAALAFLVARTAVEQGHQVRMFLAGDAAQLVRPAVVGTLQGIGTGALADHVRAVVDAGVEIFVSGMSAGSRGVDESELEHMNASFAKPATLVELVMDSDRVLSY